MYDSLNDDKRKGGNRPGCDETAGEMDAVRGKGMSAARLRGEKDFVVYMGLLKQFSRRYMILVAASDTPCGPDFIREADLLMDVGFHENLCGKFRQSYAAVIDAGELIYEKLSLDLMKPVEYSCAVDNGISIKIKSVCFAVPEPNSALIIINGKNHSPGMRGLNFVVYDKVIDTVIDAVNFDTYSSRIPCRRPAVIQERLMDWAERHPAVSVMCFNMPQFPIENLSGNEAFILQNAVGRGTILSNLDKPIFALNQYLNTEEEIIEALTAPKSYHDMDGVRRFVDIHGKAVNTAAGHRVTTDQPKSFARTVFIMGGCTIFGIGSPDEGTIASHLQRLFNEFAPEQQVVVENYGYYLTELDGSESEEEIKILDALPVRPGDIVLLAFGGNDELPFLDMHDASRRPHPYGEIFFDNMHYTRYGYQMIADRIFERLEQLEYFSGKAVCHGGLGDEKPSYQGLGHRERRELEEYKKILTEFYDSMFGIRIGACVMNCNPFTLGHRYLIEAALEQCDYLMVFVVEEDKSDFTFEDRLKMVDMGTADLKKVTVIPSGRFIISSLTFSEYFNKSEMQDRVIDSSMDVTLFAREIAPCLHIDVRFAGEEPFDCVTRQYNEAMRRILPQYGIQFIEIPRKEMGGRAVSASYIRQLIHEKDFASVSELVPETTFEYLRERFHF